jgi:hypothetical protein
MHPQAPALVQHGSPRGKQAFVQVMPLQVVVTVGGIWAGGLLLPELDPVPGSVGAAAAVLPATHVPKLQTWFVAVQSTQAAPPLPPHAVSSRPVEQAPLEQHPLWQLSGLQTAAAPSSPLPPLAATPLSSSPPVALLRPVASSPPPLLPLVLLAPPPPSPLASKPASSVPKPSELSPGPPVAHATTMNPPPSKSAPRATQPTPETISRLLPKHTSATRNPAHRETKSVKDLLGLDKCDNDECEGWPS